jgi:hypothetical protein
LVFGELAVLGSRNCAGEDAERGALWIVQAGLRLIEKGLRGHSPDSLSVEYIAWINVPAGVVAGHDSGNMLAALRLLRLFCHRLDFLRRGSSLVVSARLFLICKSALLQFLRDFPHLDRR